MTKIQMTYEEFHEHVVATDSVTTRVGEITRAIGDYVGRECLIGEYNHTTNTATLYCV